MKIIKYVTYSLAMLMLMGTFSQCSTAQKLQNDLPVALGEVYFQQWISGIQDGGSGINLFIPVTTKSDIILDSAYFRTQVKKLEVKTGTQLYVGRFDSAFNQPKYDIILSSDPKEEYSNQMPSKTINIPFELKDDECVVSYKKEGETLYFKISNITQKATLNYPSAPPNRQ